jgi:hypothetical protein
MYKLFYIIAFFFLITSSSAQENIILNPHFSDSLQDWQVYYSPDQGNAFEILYDSTLESTVFQMRRWNTDSICDSIYIKQNIDILISDCDSLILEFDIKFDAYNLLYSEWDELNEEFPLQIKMLFIGENEKEQLRSWVVSFDKEYDNLKNLGIATEGIWIHFISSNLIEFQKTNTNRKKHDKRNWTPKIIKSILIVGYGYEFQASFDNISLVCKTKIDKSENNISFAFKKREKHKQKTIKVRSPYIDIEIWDDEIFDHDTISLYFNDDCILDSYEIEKKKYSIPITLNKGSNSLVVVAHNEGRFPPNTVAITYTEEGRRPKFLKLISDLKTNGEIEFILN